MVDRRTIVGLIALMALLVWMLVTGAGWGVTAFWQTPSLVFVMGGAVLATLVASGTGLKTLRSVLSVAFRPRTDRPRDLIMTLVALAEIARRDGLLAMEKPVSKLQDDFTRRAMQMAIDGTPPETIEQVMRIELEGTDLRHVEGKGLLESMARFAPAFGMMGTLIGLVVMLGRMDDPSRIGPGMAVALLTTLYGLVMANLFCLPLARRLAQRSSQELLIKTIALRGVLAIQAGDNPRVVAQKLRAHLPAGAGEEFSWTPISKAQPEARPEHSESDRPARATPVKASAPAAAAPKIDEKTAKKLASQLQKVLGKRQRFVDAA